MNLTRRQWLTSALASLLSATALPAFAARFSNFKRVQTQYIAALGFENANSGKGAETWGLWTEDPGPIGVWLRLYQTLAKAGNIAPSGWRFDIDDWWLDENGLIMKAPDFPIPATQYIVTNGEENVAILTIEAPDATGNQNWSLDEGAKLKDVTHGPCRSARYTPEGNSGTCSPKDANQAVFPLAPGESPPPVVGCKRKEYAVLIVVGLPLNS